MPKFQGFQNFGDFEPIWSIPTCHGSIFTNPNSLCKPLNVLLCKEFCRVACFCDKSTKKETRNLSKFFTFEHKSKNAASEIISPIML